MIRKISFFLSISSFFLTKPAFAQMSRFLPEPEYGTGYGYNSGGNFLGLLIFLLILLNAFISWDTAARLRLTIAVVCWITLAFWGMSEGNLFGVLIFAASFFVPLFVTEPIAVLLERILQLNKIEKSQSSRSKEIGKPEEKQEQEKITKSISSEGKSRNQDNEYCSWTQSMAYENGFHDGVCPNKIFAHCGIKVPESVLGNYELGFRDGWMYTEDLKSIKEKATSEVDLFLTLLLVFEESLVAGDLRENLVEVYHKAVEEYQEKKELIKDARRVEEVNFLIDEIGDLIFPVEYEEIETT